MKNSYIIPFFPFFHLSSSPSDTYDPYEEKEAGGETILMNPGSFAKSGFSFKVYYPSNGTVEDCQVPGDI